MLLRFRETAQLCGRNYHLHNSLDVHKNELVMTLSVTKETDQPRLLPERNDT